MKRKRYNLKIWRMQQGRTQADIAAKLGISTGHYKSIENGVYDPSDKILKKFSKEYTYYSESKIEFLFRKEQKKEVPQV